MGFDNLRSVKRTRAPKCLLLCIDVSWSMLFGKVDMEWIEDMERLVLGCIDANYLQVNSKILVGQKRKRKKELNFSFAIVYRAGNLVRVAFRAYAIMLF